jgi:hypothetical protein
MRFPCVYSPDAAPPPPMSTHTIHAALYRSTQPSLGSIALSALILASIRALALASAGLRALPALLPLPLRPYVAPGAVALGYALAWVEQATNIRTLSAHALVYVGLTGDAFVPAARRARALTSAVEGTAEGKYKRKFRTERELSSVAPQREVGS